MIFKEINQLNDNIKNEILRLLKYSKHNPLELEDMWTLMDIVWDEIGCNNKKIDRRKISEFYSHPVWILNGIFTENHKQSLENRHAISDYIKNKHFDKIIDFGGGWGALGRIIAKDNPNSKVYIYDEYPSKYAIEECSKYKNIVFIKDIIDNEYDCLISTDVLEHVTDPLNLFEKMVKAVKTNGILIIGNNFNPVIKCHLPSTFHLRYTFKYFAKLMGLKKIDHIVYAQVYIKEANKKNNWILIRILERLSKFMFPLLTTYYLLKRKIRKIFK